jgi:hypothetical protein
VATPSPPEKNRTWFTAAGSRAITRQCRPASEVPISVRPQEDPARGQPMSAQACAGVGGAEGQRVPCAVPLRLPGPPGGDRCQISARAAPRPGWPSSQPETGRGNATAVYSRVAPAVRVRSSGVGAVPTGAGAAPVPAGAEQAAASRPHAATASAGMNRERRIMSLM